MSVSISPNPLERLDVKFRDSTPGVEKSTLKFEGASSVEPLMMNLELSELNRADSHDTDDFSKLQRQMNKLKSLADDPLLTYLNENQYDASSEEEKDEKGRTIPRGCHVLVHDKYIEVSPVSLRCMKPDDCLRKRVIWLIEWRWFDNFILFVILLNSIALASTDYTVVDSNFIPVARGYSVLDPTTQAESKLNEIVELCNVVFTFIFTAECVLKIIGRGFYRYKTSYIRDPWNWVDFLVVISGIIESVPGVPKVSALRLLRVLRPLRTLNTMPNLKALVTSLIKALPGLVNVLIVLAFVFLTFGILGNQLWQGQFKFRCRLTPAPVQLPQNLTATYLQIKFNYDNGATDAVTTQFMNDLLTNRTAFPYCLPGGPAVNYDRNPGIASGINYYTSPWGPAYVYDCAWPEDNMNQPWVCSLDPTASMCNPGTWCGSNFDFWGNDRFRDPIIMAQPVYNSNLDYDFTSFDSVPTAVLSIFQTLTNAGWSNIMYKAQDASGVVGHLFFVTIVVWGSFFLVNLTLAVIVDSFEKPEYSTQQAKLMAKELARQLSQPAAVPKHQFPAAAKLVEHPLFTAFVSLCIIINTVILAMDRYPLPSDNETFIVEILNAVLTIIFAIELILKLIGLGFRSYLKDRFNIFDAVIVLVSLADLGVSLHTVRTGKAASSTVFTALRSVRLFRLFKLARSWTALQVLLRTMVKSLWDIQNFLVIFCLYIFMFAIMGQTLFANRLHFDYLNYKVGLTEPGYPCCYKLPITTTTPCSNSCGRYHFDDLLNAIITVFQILTGDNWNNAFFDCRRAAGSPVAIGYFVTLYATGVYLLVNLLVTILINNFEEEEEEDGEAGDVDIDEIIKRSVEEAKHSGLNQVFLNILSLLPSCSGGCRCRRQLVKPVHPEDNLMLGADILTTKTISTPVTPADTATTTPPIEDIDFDAKGHKTLTDAVEVRGDAMLATPSAKAEVFLPKIAIPVVTGIAGSTDSLPTNSAADDLSGDRGSAQEEFMKNHKHFAKYTRSGRRTSQTMHGALFKPEVLTKKELKRLLKIEALEKQKCESCHRDLGDCICMKSRSLCCLQTTNPFRVKMASIIYNRSFDNFILGLIALSSILLAVDNPLDPPDDTKARFLNVISDILTVFFTLEMIAKIIVQGLLLHERSYLRSAWNCLDCFIVVTAWSSFVLSFMSSGRSNPALAGLKSLRTLRGFRPLRAISRNPGMKLIVNAIIASIPSVSYVILVIVLILLIFAIVGVSYAKGALSMCQGSVFNSLDPMSLDLITNPMSYTDLLNSTSANLATMYNGTYDGATSKAVCLWMGCTWDLVNARNMDNIRDGMFTLFQFMTAENWTDFMNACIDSMGIDMQPIRDHNRLPWNIYWILYISIGFFFLANLFIGAVVNSFNKMKKQLGVSALLTNAQREWAEAQQILNTAKLKPVLRRSNNRCRGKLFDFVTDSKFETFIMFCILINTIFMLISYQAQPKSLSVVQETANYVFAGIFTLEMILKVIAFGPKQYFRDSWNCFDFTVVIGSNAGIFVTVVFNLSIGTVASVVRSFRVGRILRLAKRAKGLTQLFDTLVISIPSLANITSVFLLVLFTFSIIGVDLFAKVNYNGDLDQHSNFQSVTMGMLSLLRLATEDNWDGFMYNMGYSSPGCVDDPPYDPTVCGFNNFLGCTPINGCGSRKWAFLYCVAYTVVVSFVMVNVFIAVILENFSGQKDEKAENGLSKEHMIIFTKHWLEFDPDATYFVKTEDFELLVRKLEPPLGITNCTRKQASRLLIQLDAPVFTLPNGDSVVEFTEAVMSLGRHMVSMSLMRRGEILEELPKVVREKAAFENMTARAGHATKQKFKNLIKRKEFTLGQQHSARLIQRAIKRRNFRKVIETKKKDAESDPDIRSAVLNSPRAVLAAETFLLGTAGVGN